MFDPLASSPFADTDPALPPWPTTPHSPNSPIPNLRRSSLRPTTPDNPRSPPPGPVAPLGREPQIYGQPEPGLISPRTNVASNGTKFEKAEPYLRVRITLLDRNRRDILVRFDAQTNLANFTGSTYKNVSRSYLEFQQLYDSIIHTNPQTIIPALPLAQTSAPTDEEDDRLIKIMLQRWLTRICDDPVSMRDEELRSFIESDFGYQPTPRPRRKTGSAFSLIRRGVPDEDEELQQARFELTKLEGQFFDAAKAVDKLARARKSLAVAQGELGNKLVSITAIEPHPPLGNALRKLGRTWHSLSDLDQAQAISECVILGDTLGYQGLNARSAKETLLQRTQVLEEYQAAVKTTIAKRRDIERLKASRHIREEKVNEALDDLAEAEKYEQILATRVDGISQNLHRALQRHNKLVNDDVTTALIEHARSTIMYERQLLRELDALTPDVDAADKKFVPNASAAALRPKYIPRLDEDAKPAPASAPVSNPSTAPVSRTMTPELPPAGVAQSQTLQPPAPMQGPPPPSPTTKAHVAATTTVPRAQTQSPALGSRMHTQSPGAGPSTPPPSQTAFAAPSPMAKSMFIQPTSPLAGPPLSPRPVPSVKTPVVDPLGPLGAQYVSPSQPFGDPLSRSATAPLGFANAQDGSAAAKDPLGLATPNYMSQSVRVQPSRSRLDAREAASKLANFL